jgi:PBP1b-binding outer membrane lipoprotein LpoB
MKRVFSVLLLVLLLNGCDDGDLTLETIDFEDATTQSCSTNDIIYKLKEKEALLFEIPESSFENEPTAPDSPTIIDIDNSTYRVVYRFYNGTVATDNICNTIPPALPSVTDQWTATSGKIQIITTAVKTTNTTENSTRISGYNHNIAFKNITFDKGNGTQVYETFPFGDYVTPSTPLPFGFDKIVEQCSTSTKQIYNYVSSEAITIDFIDPKLIENTETPLNTPRTGLLSSVKNKLTYRLYSNGVLTPNYFCSTTVPALPSISEEWNAVNGVAGVSGIIEVTTIKSGTTAYKHTIVIKNATLKKGNSDFKLGDSYIYGELLTF